MAVFCNYIAFFEYLQILKTSDLSQLLNLLCYMRAEGYNQFENKIALVISNEDDAARHALRFFFPWILLLLLNIYIFFFEASGRSHCAKNLLV